MLFITLFGCFIFATGSINYVQPVDGSGNLLTRTWTDAQSYCDSTYGTYLARIDSEADFADLNSLNFQASWVGGNDGTTEGEWRWSDDTNDQFWQGGLASAGGVPTNNAYNNWISHDPNDASNSDCMQWGEWTGTRALGDWICTNPLPFVCQKQTVCEDWIYAIGRGTYGDYDIGMTAFNYAYQNSGEYIIRRECIDCPDPFRDIYYRRIGSNQNQFEPYSYMTTYWTDIDNVFNTDFELYNNLNDAINGNLGTRWTECNFSNQDTSGNSKSVGFPRDCRPNTSVTNGGRWNSFYSGWDDNVRSTYNIRFSIYSPGNGNCLPLANY